MTVAGGCSTFEAVWPSFFSLSGVTGEKAEVVVRFALTTSFTVDSSVGISSLERSHFGTSSFSFSSLALSFFIGASCGLAFCGFTLLMLHTRVFSAGGLGVTSFAGLCGPTFAILLVCSVLCDTKDREFLHRLYFMWLKRCDLTLQVKGHWKHWYLKGLPGGLGM